MQFRARFPDVEARLAAIVDPSTGKIEEARFYLLRDMTADRTTAVVDAEAFDALYERVAGAGVDEPEELGEPVRRKKAGKPAKAKRAPASKTAPTAEASQTEPGSDTLRGRILALLKKKAYSSGELIAALGVPSPHVYSTCNQLKTKGAIVSRQNDDPNDYERKWFLAEVKF